MDKFIPVKITDKQWAHKLLDGEVFMRPLYEFGSWGVNDADTTVKNLFRGDKREGTTAVFENPRNCDALKDLAPEFIDIVRRVYYVDDDDIPYFKIFSLYCMEYDPVRDFFYKPDPRMKEFGDTAVIIRDFNEFLERYAKALFSKYEYICSMLDRVSFYDYSDTKHVNPLFSKSKRYSYQNELRLAFTEIEHDRFARGEHAEEAMSMVRNLDRITLQIGDIRDIAYELPIDDFLELKLNMPLRFPMRESGQVPSNFDNVVQFTKEQMKNYRSRLVRVTVET